MISYVRTPHHYSKLINLVGDGGYVYFYYKTFMHPKVMGNYRGTPLSNIQTLGLYCKRRIEGIIEERNCTIIFFCRRAEENINIADMFLLKYQINDFLRALAYAYSHGINTKLKDYYKFILPTHVYLDCSIPWELWLFFYFADLAEFRDQLLLKEEDLK